MFMNVGKPFIKPTTWVPCIHPFLAMLGNLCGAPPGSSTPPATAKLWRHRASNAPGSRIRSSSQMTPK